MLLYRPDQGETLQELRMLEGGGEKVVEEHALLVPIFTPEGVILS